MTEHQQKADSLEREIAEMEERSEQLGDEIADTRKDWEEKRRDETIPTAPAPESGLPPEANYTQSGDQPPRDGEEAIPPPDPNETD